MLQTFVMLVPRAGLTRWTSLLDERLTSQLRRVLGRSYSASAFSARARTGNALQIAKLKIIEAYIEKK